MQKPVLLQSLVAIVVAAIAVGCAAPPRISANDTAQLQPLVKSKRDDFKKLTEYRGPDIGGRGSLLLRAWKPDSGPTRYQVYVNDYYSGPWRFYETAHDSDGNRLTTLLISRDVVTCSRYTGCTHEEHVGINVDRAYLEQRAAGDGMRFKLSGKAGEAIFLLPSGYIRAFLNAVQ